MTLHYEDDPPTCHRHGLPTWVWVVIVILLVVIDLPLLLFGVILLYCLLVPLDLHVGP